MINATDLEALQAKHGQVASYMRRAPIDGRAAPAHLRIVLAQRVISDLIDRHREPGIMGKALALLKEIEERETFATI